MIPEQIFFNLSPDLFCLLGTDGYFKKVNPTFERVLGFTIEEILKEAFINLVHPDDRIATIHEVEKLQIGTTKTSFENRWRCQDGSYRWLSWTIYSALSEDVLYGIGRDTTEQKQNEETLHDTRTRLEAALNAGAIATWTFDLINNRVVADKNLKKLFSVSPEEAAGGSLESYVRAIHPDDCKQVNEEIQAAIKRRSDYEAEYRIVQRDGSVRWVIARGRVECDHIGNPVSLPGVVLDITERKEIEKALFESERRFRFLAEQGPSYLWLTDAEGKLIYINNRWLQWVGVTMEEASAFGWQSRIHPEDVAPLMAAWREAAQSGSELKKEHRVRGADGTARWVLTRALPEFDEQGHLTRWFGLTLDIQEQKEAEEALQESETKFRQLANSIPQLAWMANPDGWIFWYNQQWYEYTGTTPEQMEGWGWQSVHDPEILPKVIEQWTASISTGKPFEMEFPIKNAEAEFEWFLTRVNPFKDASGKILLWFGTNTNVTYQRRLVEQKQELLESERAARSELERASRLKDEFLLTLSHELRTPLNAILGWSQLLRTAKTDAARMAQGLDIIERNVRVQGQLIDDLLDMSRIISGKLRLNVQRVELATVIEAAFETVRWSADAKNIRLQKVLDHQAGIVSGDPSRLQQIIWNLVSNAIKFTPKGGRVQVVLERINSHVEISVIDTGQGIKPEFLPYVFERFRQADASTTRQHGGLGLGLSIVKHLTEMHGGSITVKSAGEGKGTTFIVALPLVVVHPQQDEISSYSAEAKSSIQEEQLTLEGIKVLVVDDEPDARELVKLVLESCNAQVITAASAQEALETLQYEEMHILVSDIGMPEEDGYQLIRKVRKLSPDRGGKIPAVALTAYARAEDRKRALLSGYQMHVTKPIEPSELIAVVSSLTSLMPKAQNSEL
ncbi:MAG TPA: PAS domain-containing protein [Oculatellaceae cyanobacterium]|jgi:PAS domain S-box-containing protein